MDAIMQWGISVILALQSLPGLTGVMKLFTTLGNEEFFLVLLPTIFWCVDTRLGISLTVALVTTNSLNGLLKIAFHLPRPYWIDSRVQALSSESSYGLPSGHALNTTAIWGTLAASLKKVWVWGIALFIILMVSLSRMYLGVHFPTDVLGGWVLGAAFVWAWVTWEQPLVEWLKQRRLWEQLGLAFMLSLTVLVLFAGILAAIAPTPDPISWEQNAAAASAPEAVSPAIAPRDTDSAVAMAGMILGLGASLALRQRGQALFDAKGPWVKRLARLVIGLAGILFFWFGLKLIAPHEPFWFAGFFRYGRYALVMFWALYLAPGAFVKLKLAEEK